MSMSYTDDAEYIPLRCVAGRLGVPLAWLKAEARAGRIPHFKAGRRWLARLAEVEAALDARTVQGANTGPASGDEQRSGGAA